MHFLRDAKEERAAAKAGLEPVPESVLAALAHFDPRVPSTNQASQGQEPAVVYQTNCNDLEKLCNQFGARLPLSALLSLQSMPDLDYKTTYTYTDTDSGFERQGQASHVVSYANVRAAAERAFRERLKKIYHQRGLLYLAIGLFALVAMLLWLLISRGGR